MVTLFLLGAVQGAIGWFMVKSGLVPEKYFVGHIELTTHFIAALGLLCYTLWFALGLLQAPTKKVINARLRGIMLAIVTVLFFQLIYGAFMAGLKAAVTAPTWPDINGQIIPEGLGELSPFSKNLLDNKITIQFIHRGLAYLLLVLITYWYFAASVIKDNPLFSRLRFWLLLLVVLQVVLGICTVLNATYPDRLVIFGVSHQFVAMALLIDVVSILFVLKRK
jgi:cytochrome c oxidase assembly protein subunit 15